MVTRWFKRFAGFLGMLFEASKVGSAILAVLVALGFLSIAAGAYSRFLTDVIWLVAAIILATAVGIFLYTILEEIRDLRRQGKLDVEEMNKLRHQLDTSSKALEDARNQLNDFTIPSTYTAPLVDVDSPNDYEFKVIRKDVEYGYGADLQTMWQKKHYIVKALHNGVRSFPDRFLWTGTPGTLKYFTNTPGFAIHNEVHEEFWTYFEVIFPRPLSRGESCEFTLEWELFDERKTAKHFLSSPIDFPTDHLTLRVVLPNGHRPTLAIAYKFKNYLHRIASETNELAFNLDTHSLTYEVNAPVLLGKYMIRWWFGVPGQ